MRWLFAALLILVAAIAAQGELITHSTGSGGSVVVGSGVVVGGSNGCVLFKATTAKIGCNSTFTSNDAGTQLVIPNTVTNGAAANLAITATAELRLASNGGSVMRYNGDGHFFASAAGAYGSGLEIASTNNIFWVDNSGSAFAGRMGFGGSTNAFPALARSGTTLQVKLSDGSADAPISASGATFSGLTTGTNADFVCLSAGGVLLIQTTACTISTLAHKPDWRLFEEDAIASIRRLEVGTFHFDAAISKQADPNARSLQIGLNAENVASVIPQAAVYEDDMKTPKSYRQEGIIALLVKAIQQQQSEIDALKKRIE